MSFSSESSKVTPPVVVMTIAGSDSSGGAGIQADLKTISALECYGTTAITALTAQNTSGVNAVFPADAEFVAKQISAVLEDMPVAAFKTGMLYDANIAQSVASTLKNFFNDSNRTIPPLVIDPVCVSTSGHRLLESDAISVLVNELFPLSTLITPNKTEAELLLKMIDSHGADPETQISEISSVRDAIKAAKKLSSSGSCDVLLKGGHLTTDTVTMRALLSSWKETNEDDVHIIWKETEPNMEILRVGNDINYNAQLVIDILFERKGNCTSIFVRERIDSKSTHGTGCTLSAAIACFLAKGFSTFESVKHASEYTYAGIQAAYPLGKGHGPLNHMHALAERILPLPSKQDQYPFVRALIRSNAEQWRKYVEHPFVIQLGKGTLPRECFVHFVKQDYQYLKYYARAYGMLIAKSRSFSTIAPSVDTLKNVLEESTKHREHCRLSFGISEEELETTPESAATAAYGASLLDAALHGDETKLIVTLAACLLGYGEVGLWLKSRASIQESGIVWKGNPYLKWMEDYSGPHYQDAVRIGLGILEDEARADPPSAKRFAEWKEAWNRCTLLETQFWDMAMNLS
ncbi:thiamin biosynthesis [Pyrrhoderma noxium]|uniref:Thiamin biosynthesis n=1 Tax=Pyrrhoderma noxium TaxID=2282107 RepID=A0A286UV04_9AGAM|nr:thiamin biosynthesis [Pyrrhoderma noxium]